MRSDQILSYFATAAEQKQCRHLKLNFVIKDIIVSHYSLGSKKKFQKEPVYFKNTNNEPSYSRILDLEMQFGL